MAEPIGAARAIADSQSDAPRATWLVSLGAVAAALGAASCCVIPFLLFTAGVTGAWIGTLTALEPYQPIFAGVSLGCIGLGAWRIHRARKRACASGYCGTAQSDRIARFGLWAASVLVLLAVGFPYLARVFMPS